MKNQANQVKKKPNGCGCSNIPIAMILILIGGTYWLLNYQKYFLINQLLTVG